MAVFPRDPKIPDAKLLSFMEIEPLLVQRGHRLEDVKLFQQAVEADTARLVGGQSAEYS